MKRLILMCLLLLILSSSCAAAAGDLAGYPYIIYASGSDEYYWCKRFDEEKRIGYDCLDGLNRGLKEYHLGISDGWAIR